MVTTLVFSLLGCVRTAAQPTQPQTHFEQGNRAVGIPFEIIEGAIVVTATLNDSVEVKLFFDTGFGSSGVLLHDPEMGSRMALNYVSTVDLGGGGTEGAKTADVAAAVKISLPGVTFPAENAIVLRKPDSLLTGMIVDGIIGGTLTRSVVEIDYDQSVINLYDHSVFQPDPDATEHPVFFSYGIPVIDGALEIEEGKPVPVKLLLDTGAPLMEVMVFTWPEPHFRPNGPTMEFVGRGMGGDVTVQYGRIRSLRLGKYKFENATATFTDSTAYGTATVLGQNGLLGHETLRRFNVVLDYAGSRVFLKPNRRFDHVCEVEMTGITSKPLKNGYHKVFRIRADSPAATQDVRIGDLIVEVDGRDVRTVPFEELYRTLTRDGASVTLTLERGSERLQRTLALRRQI